MTAVLIRLAKHPERRDDLEELGLVIASAVPLVLPILAAAAGSVGTLAGTVVGGIAGSEAGAVVKASCLLLLKEGGKMLEPLVKFLRRFIKGDILAVLRGLKFVHYGEALVHYAREFLGKLLQIVRGVIAKAKSVSWIARVGHFIERLEQIERDFYGVQNLVAVRIPKALAMLDSRLAKALEEHMAGLNTPLTPPIPPSNRRQFRCTRSASAPWNTTHSATRRAWNLADIFRLEPVSAPTFIRRQWRKTLPRSRRGTYPASKAITACWHG